MKYVQGYKYQVNDILPTKPYSYKVQKLLGQGSFGQVYECILNKNQENPIIEQQPVAIKVLEQKQFEKFPLTYTLLNREVQILQSCNHPNILRFIDVQDDNENFYLLTEICNQGNLRTYIRKIGEKQKTHFQTIIYIISETQALNFMQQIISAFYYLQNIYKGQVIVHRDIKMENILVHDGQLKLGDLGFSRIVDENERMESHKGSIKTIAPEIIMQKKYDPKVDIFSLGIVFYQMLFGTYPFQGDTPHRTLKQIKEQNYSLAKFNINISEKSQNLIKRMLQFDPNKRISFEELFQMFKLEEPKDLYFSQFKSSYSYEKENQFEKVKIKILGNIQEQKRNMEELFQNKNSKQKFKIKKLKEKKFKLYFEDTQGFQKYDSIPLQSLRADGYFIIVNMIEDQNHQKIIKYWLRKIRDSQGVSYPVLNSIQIILNTSQYKKDNNTNNNSCSNNNQEIDYDISQNKQEIIEQMKDLKTYCKYELGLNCIHLKLSDEKKDNFYTFLDNYLFRISQYLDRERDPNIINSENFSSIQYKPKKQKTVCC